MGGQESKARGGFKRTVIKQVCLRTPTDNATPKPGEHAADYWQGAANEFENFGNLQARRGGAASSQSCESSDSSRRAVSVSMTEIAGTGHERFRGECGDDD